MRTDGGTAPRVVVTLGLRLVVIFLGATSAAYGLWAVGDPAPGRPGYLEAVEATLFAEARLGRALLRTLVIAAAAGTVAVMVGGAAGWVRGRLPTAGRLGRAARAFGGLVGVVVGAVTAAGLLWYPLAGWADERDRLPVSVVDGAPLDARTVATLVLWGALAGLAAVPLAGRTHGGTPVGAAVVLLAPAVASVEIAADLDGAFALAVDALGGGDWSTAFDVAVAMTVVGLAVAAATVVFRHRSRRRDRSMAAGPVHGSAATLGIGTVAGAAGFALVAVALAALVGDRSGPAGLPFQPPSVSGPLLGSDRTGQSLTVPVIEAAGWTLGTAVAIGGVAALVGWGAATAYRFLERQSSAVRRAAGLVPMLVDAAWWPVPVLAFLAAAAAPQMASPFVALLAPGVLAIGAIPLLFRLAVRGMAMPTLAASGAGLGLAGLVMVGATGLPPLGADRPTLGTLLATGRPTFSDAPWMAWSPLAVALALLLVLYAAAAVLHRRFAPVPAPAETVDPESVNPESVDPAGSVSTNGSATDDGARASGPPLAVPAALAGPTGRAGPLQPTEWTESPPSTTAARLATPIGNGKDRTRSAAPAPLAATARAHHRRGAGLDHSGSPAGPPKAGIDPTMTVELAAITRRADFDPTRTVRLRPADLRRAGVAPPGDDGSSAAEPLGRSGDQTPDPT
jgi:hypothetical protein